MGAPSATPPDVVCGPRLTVSWKAPGSNTWRPFENGVARAILAAAASGQATFKLDNTLRRSPRLNPRERETKRARVDARPSKSATLQLTLKSALDGVAASNADCDIRWGFSSTCTFDRLPNTAGALSAMVAKCKAAEKRQVLSELLDYVISKPRLEGFLSNLDVSSPDGLPYPCIENVRISRLAMNASARPRGALYERFLNTMARHVKDLGGALQSLMGSPSQSIAPLTLAFHGTPPVNIPSILADGMLPEKRVAGGDWFGTSPLMSVHYCQKHCLPAAPRPPFRLILFLLLPVKKAVQISQGSLIVMGNERFKLPLGTFDLDYDIQAPWR